MRYFAGAAAVLVLTPVAAKAATADDFQIWASFQASGSLVGNVVGGLELQGRLVDDSSRPGVLVVRPSIGYKLSKAVTVHMGYAHLTTFNAASRDVQENRTFQQINWTVGKVGGGVLASRTRFEERFVNTGAGTGLRLRFQLKYTVPLNVGHMSFVVSSEPLLALNTTDWGQRAGLDQWRNFAGISFPVSGKFAVETGFQHRYQKRFNQPDRSDFIVPVTLSYKF